MDSWFEFLRLEADLALTFIESARLKLDTHARSRSLRRARTALEQIERALTDPESRGLTQEEAATLDQRRVQVVTALRNAAALKWRIHAGGI